MLSVKKGSIKYHFWVFGMTWPGMEPRVSWAIGEHSNHYANVWYPDKLTVILTFLTRKDFVTSIFLQIFHAIFKKWNLMIFKYMFYQIIYTFVLPSRLGL